MKHIIFPQKNIRAFSLLVFFVVLALLGSYILNDQRYFFGPVNLPLSDSESLFFSCAYFLLYGAFLILLHRYSPVRHKPLFVLLFALAFAVDLVAICGFPGIHDTDQLIYQTSAFDRVRYCFYGAVGFSLLYLIFAVVPQMTGGSDFYDLAMAIIVAVVFAMIFYSYIEEASLYWHFFLNGGPDDAYAVPQSWAQHKNVYAFMLFNGLVGECYLESRHPHAWRWAIIIFLFLNQFFVLSKTTLVVATFFLIAFYLSFFVKTLSQHKLRNWIVLGSFVLLTIVLLVLAALPANEMFWASRYLRSISKLMFSSIAATMMDRLYVWSDVVRCISINPTTLWVGAGYGAWTPAIYTYLMGAPNLYYPVDSAWVTDLARGGIFGVIFSGILWLYLLYQIILAIHRKERFAYVTLFYWVALLMRSFIESGDFASVDSYGAIFSVMLILPLLSSRIDKKDKSLSAYQISLFQNPCQNRYKKAPFERERFFKKSFVIASFASFFAVASFLLVGLSAKSSLANLDHSLVGIAFALILPYLVSIMALLHHDRRLGALVLLLIWTGVYALLAFFLPDFAKDWLGVFIPTAFGIILLIAALSLGTYHGVPNALKISVSYSAIALLYLLVLLFASSEILASLAGAVGFLALATNTYFFASLVFPLLGFRSYAPRKIDDLWLILWARYSLGVDRAYLQATRKEGKGA